MSGSATDYPALSQISQFTSPLHMSSAKGYRIALQLPAINMALYQLPSLTGPSPAGPELLLVGS